MRTNESFIEELVRLLPELKPVHDQALAKSHSYEFMDDLVMFVIAEADKSRSRALLATLLRHLESGLGTGPPAVRDLVRSFADGLIGATRGTTALEVLQPLMGPYLMHEIEQLKTSVSFIEELIRLVPELKPIFDEHVTDNDFLLPHVFMGDVTRFAIAEAGKSRSCAIETLLQHLENGLESGSNYVKELISLSFAENLLGETTALKVLKPLMGPNLKTEMETLGL